MGWFTNYEVEFLNDIDWDDSEVRRVLPDTVEYLYLRDLELPRVIFCVYSHDSIEKILFFLKGLYMTNMRYRIYRTWTNRIRSEAETDAVTGTGSDAVTDAVTGTESDAVTDAESDNSEGWIMSSC